MPTVLIADDQADVREALRLLLKAEGYTVQLVSSPQAVLERLAGSEFDLLLMDLNYTRDTTSGQEGLDLLDRIASLDATLPVVVMTAWGSVETAVEAMRRGAKDFCQKPWENARLLATIRTQIELGHALRKGRRLEAENQALREDNQLPFIAQAASMRPVLDIVQRVGPSDANVLISGENGSGKGILARAFHAASGRASRPLVTVNMGGLSETLFESELFGHVKGAFTDARSDRVGRFELADNGTLFLDEIANLTPSQQTRLLRVLETGEFERVGSSRTKRVNVRILSATNADLPAEVAAGRFRQDLMFRLNTVPVHVPPLRERPEDIPLLASFFLDEQLRRYRKPIHGFSAAALERLARHSWPGNVRELAHVVERAVLMCVSSQISPADLGLQQTDAPATQLENMSLEEVEQYLIRKTLTRCNGNALQAAEALGLSRSAFYRRLEKYGL